MIKNLYRNPNLRRKDGNHCAILIISNWKGRLKRDRCRDKFYWEKKNSARILIRSLHLWFLKWMEIENVAKGEWKTAIPSVGVVERVAPYHLLLNDPLVRLRAFSFHPVFMCYMQAQHIIVSNIRYGWMEYCVWGCCCASMSTVHSQHAKFQVKSSYAANPTNHHAHQMVTVSDICWKHHIAFMSALWWFQWRPPKDQCQITVT